MSGELHALEWDGLCSRCEKQFMASGLFAVQIKSGQLPPLCRECDQLALRTKEHPGVTRVRDLFAAASAFHVVREDSDLVAGRPTRCDTTDPSGAMAAWNAVLAAIDPLLQLQSLCDDPWVLEVRADAMYGVACMQSLLGDKAAALETLDRVIRTGYAKFELFEQDADLDTLRGDPVFESLVKESKLRVANMTIQQVEARLGQPRKKIETTEKSGLWIYYYDEVEVYFDRAGVVDWTCLVKYEEDAHGG